VNSAARRGRLVLAVAALALGASGARAQAPALANVVGTWDGTFTIGATDSAIATFVLTATPDAGGWTLLLPGHAPHRTRVVAVGGDSVVTETGPYASTRQPGQTVVTRMVVHVTGDAMAGTFRAHYPSGDSQGKFTARRRKV
jgi:hypothetical protein